MAIYSPAINWGKEKLTHVLLGGGWGINAYMLFLRFFFFFNEKMVNEVARPVECRLSYTPGVSASFTQFFFFFNRRNFSLMGNPLILHSKLSKFSSSPLFVLY